MVLMISAMSGRVAQDAICMIVRPCSLAILVMESLDSIHAARRDVSCGEREVDIALVWRVVGIYQTKTDHAP